MAEVVVGVVIDQLVSAAGDWLHEEISLLKGLKPKLDNMKSKLQIIKTVVQDAENQSVKKDIVKLWLVKLQDVSYDMDDVLDEWRTTLHIPEFNSDEIVGSSSSSSSSSSSATRYFSLKKNSFYFKLRYSRKIAKRIKAINERINSVFLEMKEFKLASKVVGNDDLNKIISQDRLTTSFVDESKIYGRDKDKKFLLSKVLSMNSRQEKGPQMISIVGAGGLGKTTLAQMIYNDKKVKEKFGEKRIWVCVSNPFDEVNVARDVLEGLKVDHSKMTSLQALHQSVRKSLYGQKFLLVLDDVWDENFGKWDKLSECLMFGEPESKVLVTTRKEEVAKIMGTTPSNILKPQHISDSDCWFLMSRIAFQGRTNTYNELEEFGKEIVKKCKGLPLAAKTLGGLLISKDSVDEWKKMLSSEIWTLEQAEVELFPHIFLSYQELPPVLKRCFLILAIFPKDTKLEDNEVVAIWMAHGFLNPRTEEDDMVKTGKKYLEFLVSRALLEQNDTRISMHDILHDFALHLSRDELILIDKIKNGSSSKSTSAIGSCLKSRTAHHLYIDGYKDPASIVFDLGKLRTCTICNVAANVTADIVKRLKMVRALYLRGCELEQVPEIIACLIHLRLLDLSNNKFVTLPETIGDLFNLQHLFLERSKKVTGVVMLPWRGNHALEKFPESVGKLINLQNIDKVEVGAGKNKLRLLKDLNQLRVLVIEFTSDYGDEVDAVQAAIGKKKHITELALHFSNYEVTAGVIAALQPPSTIQVLKIYWLPWSCNLLPSWITSLYHLTELIVWGGGNVSTLPPFGKLRFLKKLCITEFKALKIIGREFIGFGSKPDKNCSYFPNLVKLQFSYCNKLTGWEDLKPEDSISVMQNLEKLRFLRCDKLDKVPLRLLCQASSLKKITIEQEDSLFKIDVGEGPCRLHLQRRSKLLEMVLRTKVPKSMIYDSYITLLLDIYFAEKQSIYQYYVDKKILCLPPMGKLPYLQSLKIHKFQNVEVIGRDFLGMDDPNNNEEFVAFPHLLNLEIRGCDLLKEWEDLKPEDEGKVTVMPKLQRLDITGCPKLQVLPSRLLCQAANLEKLRCNYNNNSLAEKIMKDELLLRHVKSVYVNGQQCFIHPSTKSENGRGPGSSESLH